MGLDKLEVLTGDLRRLKWDELLIYKILSVVDNYNSNVIEGSLITLEETKSILKKGPLHPGSRSRSEGDVLGYKAAQEFMLYANKMSIPLTVDTIVDMHKKLLLPHEERYAGVLRTKGVEVTSGGRNVGYSKGEYVVYELSALLDNFHSNPMLSVSDVFKNAVYLKYKFLQIHPFCDGNGRLSRLILNLVLLNNKMYPLIVYVQDKERYMTAVKESIKAEDINIYFAMLAEIYSRELNEYVKYIRPNIN